ncbi:alpha/beta hydrolase family protein [Cellulomonas composti]|uniref:Alpha/beta hydrolase n=1 Tax=Cellulomonas composti TaxID=266130 RepID=A0A511J7F1_9CELL|nr:alpha/beta family hydrolase [Cellulomonas composti]GEL93920.1 alpha/beta hydrolase [Cellulomonas composti]
MTAIPTRTGPRDVAGLLLTPGAGAGRDHRTLVALEDALAPLPVRRVDFPYRQRGSRMPDRPTVAVPFLREQVEAFAAELGVGTDRIVVGGRSYGGRMCSMAVADGLPVAGLVLLSYPLHPPGKPENLRIAHLPDIDVPVLAVSGRTDPFGTPDELARELAALGGPWHLELVTGPHDPADAPVIAAVRTWLGSH